MQYVQVVHVLHSKLYVWSLDSNRNQSPLLQLDLMDPALLFVEVLVVAMLGRMKVERMKVEMKRHLELQCFVCSARAIRSASRRHRNASSWSGATV